MNQTGYTRTRILIAFVIVILIGGGYYYSTSQQSTQQPPTQSNAALLSEEESLNIAKQVVTKAMSTVQTDCFVFANIKEANTVTYKITRTFDKGCPGDPTSAPTMPQLKIDLSSRTVFMQSLDGEFRPLLEAQQPQGLLPSSAQGDSVDWKTYRNSEHGFEIKYPGDYEILSELTTPESKLIIDTHTSYIGGLLQGVGTAGKNVLAIIYLKNPLASYPNTDLDNAFIAIEKMDAKSKDTCHTIRLNNSTGKNWGPSTETISGMQYSKVGPYGDAASGHAGGGTDYAVYTNGTCFVLAENIQTSYWKVGTQKGVAAVDENAVISKLHDIIATFKPTK